MFTKHKIYYTIEVKDEDTFNFICSYSSFDEAKNKLDELSSLTDKEYRILKIAKDIEQVD